MQEVGSSRNINETLFPECLQGIFSYLDERDLQACARVCKLWKVASSDNIIWYQIAKKYVSEKQLEVLLEEENNLKTIIRIELSRRIQLAIDNSEITFCFGRGRTPSVFGRKLITYLKSSDKSVLQKYQKLKKSLDYKHKIDGRSLLFALSSTNQSEENLSVMKIVLECGANPNIKKKKHPNLLQWFKEFATPLHIASYRGDIKKVELLLHFGADPTIPNEQGDTALDQVKKYPYLTPFHKAKLEKMLTENNITLLAERIQNSVSLS